MARQKRITNKRIIKRLRWYLEQANKHRVSWNCPRPRFNESDLVGFTYLDHRQIQNPLPCNREFESPNPQYFDVFILSDDSSRLCYLLHMNIAYCNGNTLHSFLVDNENKVWYNGRLYYGKKLEED